MSCFVILLGGSLVVTARLLHQIEGARVIAADSGIKHAAPLGLRIETWLGDFDSSDASQDLLYADVPRIVFPVEKAMTDGELAVEEAIKRGATTLVLVGALGGERSDHAMLHVMLMLAIADRGVSVFLTSGTEEVWPISANGGALDLPVGTMVSIIGLSDLQGLSISGVKWPLLNHDLPLGSSLTLSNEVTGAFEATVKQGRAAIFAHFSSN